MSLHVLFLSTATRKERKETPLKGERCFKARRIVREFKPFANAELFAILSPLKDPPLLRSPRRAVGGEMLVNIKNLTVDTNLNGVARDADKQASR